MAKIGKRKKEAILKKRMETISARKAYIARFFTYFTRHHRPWLNELLAKYKERGDFPIYPMSVLPSYYEDLRDKEVALFAAFIMPLKSGFDKINQMRELIGDHPWEWFKNREFVALGVGRMQNKSTAGVSNAKIATLMNGLWGKCHIVSVPTNDGDVHLFKSIGEIVGITARSFHLPYLEALEKVLDESNVRTHRYKLRYLLLVSATSDAIGQGMWDIDPSEVKSPRTLELKAYIDTFFPDHKKYGSLDDAIRLFGFERDCDFFYCFLAYKELQKRNPKGCRLYSTKYQKWYGLGSDIRRCKWRRVQPEIDI